MKVLTIDAEYTQPGQKVIQIGAAVYDVKTQTKLEELELLVNPNEIISEEISTLTGVTNEMVQYSGPMLTAYKELEKMAKKHKCFKNPLVWGSGITNDSYKIWTQAFPTKELQDANPNFMGYRVIDVKSIYQSIQVFHNKQFSGTLKDVCSKLGLKFTGIEHSALADAINTFNVWHYLVSKYPGGF